MQRSPEDQYRPYSQTACLNGSLPKMDRGALVSSPLYSAVQRTNIHGMSNRLLCAVASCLLHAYTHLKMGWSSLSPLVGLVLLFFEQSPILILATSDLNCPDTLDKLCEKWCAVICVSALVQNGSSAVQVSAPWRAATKKRGKRKSSTKKHAQLWVRDSSEIQHIHLLGAEGLLKRPFELPHKEGYTD